MLPNINSLNILKNIVQVNPSPPSRIKHNELERKVKIDNINIHSRYIENLPVKYLVLETGRVNIDLSVCSLYSRVNR